MESLLPTWLGLISSLILVFVTGWYAVLTRRLARSAEASAASAERAANTAAAALAATVAGLDVSFSVAANGRGIPDEGGIAIGVSVFCDGATVFVHGVHLDSVWQLDEERENGGSYSLIANDRALVLDRSGTMNPPDIGWPVRLHHGEAVHMEVEPRLVVSGGKLVGLLEVSIWYSLNGTDQPIRRRVAYNEFDKRRTREIMPGT